MDHDTDKKDNVLPQETASAKTDPAVTFTSITFSDGTTISLEPNDVVVFVGPNNAGKSVALRELEGQVKGSFAGTVVKKVGLSRTGTHEEILAYIRKHTKKIPEPRHTIYSGYGFSLFEEQIASFWSRSDGLSDLSPFFSMRLQTETRITASNPGPANRVLEDPVSHPIQMLYTDDKLEYRISDYFHQAFGEDLIVHLVGGSEIPLLVGNRPTLQKGENRTSTSYCRRLLDSTVSLKEQGDGMRSFASVLLYLLAPITPSILLLDEPEAFLHPPQAKLLGELIAKDRSTRSQLFMATHSSDVLNGLLNVAPDHLRVLRIRRNGKINHVKELERRHAKKISNDPLMKYSSVLSGVFHERVIICESDSDCTFYSSLLDLPDVHGGQQPDVLFVHANGKDRMAALVKALRELDVPVDVIADIDVLNDETVFKNLLEALGGDWSAIQSMRQTVCFSIEQKRPPLNAGDITKAIQVVLQDIQPTGEFPKEKHSEIDKIFRKATPWDAVKAAGEAAIPAGEATTKFKKLQDLCKTVGLWIVSVGELEGFCKSIGGHGPPWVRQVLESRDLSKDSDLQRARAFVREIWLSRSSG